MGFFWPLLPISTYRCMLLRTITDVLILIAYRHYGTATSKHFFFFGENSLPPSTSLAEGENSYHNLFMMPSKVALYFSILLASDRDVKKVSVITVLPINKYFLRLCDDILRKSFPHESTGTFNAYCKSCLGYVKVIITTCIMYYY